LLGPEQIVILKFIGFSQIIFNDIVLMFFFLEWTYEHFSNIYLRDLDMNIERIVHPVVGSCIKRVMIHIILKV